MDDAISSTLETTAEAVVLTFVVVVAHVRSSNSVDCCLPSSLFYSDLFAGARRVYCVVRGLLDVDLCSSLDVPCRTADARDCVSLFEPAVVLSNDWPCAFAKTSLSLVEDSLRVLSTRTANHVAFAVVDTLFGEGLVFDVDLSVDVPLIGFTVAVRRKMLAQNKKRDGDYYETTLLCQQKTPRKKG